MKVRFLLLETNLATLAKLFFRGLEVRSLVGKIVLDNIGIGIKPNIEIILRPRDTPNRNSTPSQVGFLH